MLTEFEVDVEVSLTADGTSIDAEDVALLAHIEEDTSLRQACLTLGRSYAHALRRIEALEESIGPLTERTRGGTDGGGTRLTDRGQEVISAFGRAERALSIEAQQHDNRLTGRVTDRNGAFATIETEAGQIRTIAPTATGELTVAIAPEAITVHPGAEFEDPGSSSARNRLVGIVEHVDTAAEIAGVQITCNGIPLIASITRESLDRLDIEPGDEVVAVFKATATRPLVIED